jgi:hypothetical protein
MTIATQRERAIAARNDLQPVASEPDRYRIRPSLSDAYYNLSRFLISNGDFTILDLGHAQVLSDEILALANERRRLEWLVRFGAFVQKAQESDDPEKTEPVVYAIRRVMRRLEPNELGEYVDDCPWPGEDDWYPTANAAIDAAMARTHDTLLTRLPR